LFAAPGVSPLPSRSIFTAAASILAIGQSPMRADDPGRSGSSQQLARMATSGAADFQRRLANHGLRVRFGDRAWIIETLYGSFVGRAHSLRGR
jgi:hypothetical protein